MIINLNENWRLNSDALQWIVQQRKTYKRKKTGEIYQDWENKGYFRSLERAVLSCAESQIRLDAAEVGPEALIPLHGALEAMRGAVSGLEAKL